MLQLQANDAEDGFLVVLPGTEKTPVYVVIQPNLNGSLELSLYDHRPETPNDEDYRAFVTITQFVNTAIAAVSGEAQVNNPSSPTTYLTLIPEVEAVKTPPAKTPPTVKARTTIPLLPRQTTYVAPTAAQLPPPRTGMKPVRSGWRITNARGLVFPQNIH